LIDLLFRSQNITMKTSQLLACGIAAGVTINGLPTSSRSTSGGTAILEQESILLQTTEQPPSKVRYRQPNDGVGSSEGKTGTLCARDVKNEE
jgi:hypothetical protein